jgi:hypothetical protein
MMIEKNHYQIRYMKKILYTVQLGVFLFLAWAIAGLLAPIGLGFAAILIPPITMIFFSNISF